ncbi:hypothetical protein CC78DRAFT_576512 [Lojkania enalia]|uniref:Uncharacterized protein n=1 Tax=Lojkania enalia TaxID=147567 RepID=A0A9P4KF13_9PLEO|nr:hypothetical protein CC78DRAFT_576512 [Didymosphaeria enalia]
MSDSSPVVLAELSAHLQKVDEEPSTPLDVDLLEKCGLFASTPEYRSHVWQETRPLFLHLASLLPNLQQDPSPLIHCMIKLTAPYRFEDVKDVNFEAALALDAKPFHELVLSLLEKAAISSIDAQALANRPSVVSAIIRLWFCTQDTGVATKAAELLTALLRVSKNEPIPVPENADLHCYGNGPIWKRLFNDRDIYSMFYRYTSFKKIAEPTEPVLSKNQRTIAQARLLEWLPKVGNMDWNIISTGQGSDVEREIGLSARQGLLHYAALRMVDTADDLLMHMTLINFYTDLITTVKTTPHLAHNDSSLSLDFLKAQGIHKNIIDFHTSDSPSLEHSFISSRTAHYIAQYAFNYPENFERSPEMKTIRQYIHRNIQKCEPSDLSILASMPRASLIPRVSTGLAWTDSVVLDVPIMRTNQDALKTLAVIFHGPPKEELIFPSAARGDVQPKQRLIEQIYARLLTALFYMKNPTMFSEFVRHADTVAMKENALAALTLLRAVITANWEAQIPQDLIPSNGPVFQRLQQFPNSGIDLILDPTISGGVLPYLLKPATTYSNMVEGRGGAENAAYQVAMTKFDVLKALGQRLEEDGGRQDIVSMVRRRVAEGPWGIGGSAGSRIGTLDL